MLSLKSLENLDQITKGILGCNPKDLETAINELAIGNLTHQINDVNPQSAIGRLKFAIENLRKLISDAKDLSAENSSIAEELSATSLQSSKRIEESSSFIMQATQKTTRIQKIFKEGEHEKGFAVVADEVRNLAERTQESLVEINATINIIVQSIGESSEKMTYNAKNVENLTSIAHEARGKIVSMGQMMKDAMDISEKSVQSYISSGDNIDDITKSIDSINEISNKNARSAEEMASATEHLNKMTQTLNTKLSEFRT